MIEVPVSTDDSMLPGHRREASRGQSIRIAMCCVLTLLVALATPWDAGASSSSARQSTSSPLYTAQPADNDGDNIPDESDMDDDNDHVADDMDEDPFNAPSSVVETPDIIAPDQDTDNDGIGNIMDPDDDNDVIEDDEDPAPFTPVPQVNTPAPPSNGPDTPDVEAPVPAQPSSPDVQRSAPQPTGRPATGEPESVAVQSGPKDTAPLVVALPSTGGTGDIQPDFSWPTLLATLAAILGGSGLVLRQRSTRPKSQA